ncbi:MAG: GMC family oxidoreductase [Gammaproteobacteria bacterium]|nr:GMC family oxidoreductase [Gammaproteobacteria bacterium]
MTTDYDVCIIGSGAGGSPVALTLAQAGYSVLVLEKGPWFNEQDFSKDELACCRRSTYTPPLTQEQHVIEEATDEGDWVATPTVESGWDFWNGNCVGGSSNFMSGFFYRLKPVDFRLRSEFGAIAGANVVDWPISYAELEPYYTKVEQLAGISGRIVKHPQQEPRSTPDFPYPPLAENIISSWIDSACHKLGYHALPTPRAILSQPAMARNSCSYSIYCGSYGCSTGAKGSARTALLDHAVKTGRCHIQPHAKVYRLISNNKGKVTGVDYYDKQNKSQRINAKIFVVACQAVETSRLLLSSPGPYHPHGLGNNHQQVGRNLLFSAGGIGQGTFNYDNLTAQQVEALKVRGPFVNRGLQDWYTIHDTKLGHVKGGTIDFLFRHPNAIARANGQKWDDNGKLVWGKPLKRKLKAYFTEARYLQFEVFCDWLPTDNCFVSLDNTVMDKWGSSVAKVRVGYHPHDLKVGRYLTEKAKTVLGTMGARDIYASVSGNPPQNLMAGGCRFGTDPVSSVLDPDCRMHDAENLFVTDGSFMPTGGSVPYTWTIYANAFRVADKIIDQLGESRHSA